MIGSDGLLDSTSRRLQKFVLRKKPETGDRVLIIATLAVAPLSSLWDDAAVRPWTIEAVVEEPTRDRLVNTYWSYRL